MKIAVTLALGMILLYSTSSFASKEGSGGNHNPGNSGCFEGCANQAANHFASRCRDPGAWHVNENGTRRYHSNVKQCQKDISRMYDACARSCR